MKNKFNIFLIFLFVLIFISIFYKWFFQNEIIGGDWPYLFKESLQNYYFFVPSWNAWQGNGLGGTNPIYFLQTFEYLTVFVSTSLHIPWPIIYKIFWFGFFLLLSISSSFYLVSIIFKKRAFWQKCISSIIFTTNTYVLMLVDGGQMGVALSYALTPFVIARFIKLIDEIGISDKIFTVSKLKLGLLAGLFLAFQIILDPRLAYISMIAIGIYLIFKLKRNMRYIISLAFNTSIASGLVAFLINIFWLLPFLIFSQNTCERFCEAYSGVGIVKFLSFSSFPESLSLLHPNWPENIFGKVYFMRPEFLLLPIIAFSSFFFVSKTKDRGTKAYVLFFALLGIIGAFLAKGTKPPFGFFYLWLFENVPGFILFRDPTKFYLLIALSYSILIPYSLLEISNKVLSIKYKVLSRPNAHCIIPATFLVVWAFLISPAVSGQLGGTFKIHEVPKEYFQMKDFLYSDPNFFRTLWVPRQHRFSFYSKIHPSVEAGALFNATSSAQAVREIKDKGPQYFSELAIKYVVVPYDNAGEIFQKDRKYNDRGYRNTVKDLESISWLKKIDNFGKIQIFEITSVKDHFWVENDGKLSYEMISPTRYVVNVSLSFPQKLIFSEKYDSSWIAEMDGKIIKSQETHNNLNSFNLEKGNFRLEIVFLQDKAYSYGRIISLATLFGVLFIIVKYRKDKVLSN